MPSSPTWPEVPRNACVIIPIGSFEQHGPHLPLDTDTQIASHLCAQATTVVDNVVVAPPLSITASGEHAGFPGTISIGTEAFAAVIVELVRSCDWATGVILVHGHGGNLAAVQRATAILNSEQRNLPAGGHTFLEQTRMQATPRLHSCWQLTQAWFALTSLM